MMRATIVTEEQKNVLLPKLRSKCKLQKERMNDIIEANAFG